MPESHRSSVVGFVSQLANVLQTFEPSKNQLSRNENIMSFNQNLPSSSGINVSTPPRCEVRLQFFFST